MSNPTDDGSDILAELLAPRDRTSPRGRPRPPREATPAAPTSGPGEGPARGRRSDPALPAGPSHDEPALPPGRPHTEPALPPGPAHREAALPSGRSAAGALGAGEPGPKRAVVHERRRGRGCLVVLGVLVVFALAAAAGSVWLMKQVNPGGAGDEVALTIPEGTSTSGIARLLADEGIVTNATIFEYYVKFRGNDVPIQAGDYVLREHASMGATLATLHAGPQAPPYDQVTIPEGYSVWNGAGLPVPGPMVTALDDAVDRFTSDSISAVLLSGALHSRYQPADQGNLEGLLFPDTYRIEEEDTETTIVQAMIDRFDQVAAAAGYDDAEATTGLSAYETIIVASLVEREAGIDEDRAKVARVIYNRLEQGIPLGIDASIAYAVGGATDGTLTASQLAVDSPYNTREVAGLPPTPIALPGRASLEAAMHPADGPWLYYVLAGQDGHHFFTDSYDEFLEAKGRCQDLGLC